MKYGLSTFSTGKGDSEIFDTSSYQEIGKHLAVFILKWESSEEPAGANCEIVAKIAKMSAFQVNDCIETMI